MSSKASPTPIQHRVLFTLLIIAIYEILSRFPIIHIHQTGIIQPIELRFFALGLMPIITGFIIIELLSLFLPPLTTWRHSGIIGRQKLTRWAFNISFCAACLHGYAVVNSLPGLETFERLALIGILLAGVNTIYLLAMLLNKSGLANGFILIFFISDISEKASRLLNGIKLAFAFPLPVLTFDLKMNLFYITVGLFIIGIAILKNIKSPNNILNKYFWGRPSFTYANDHKQYSVLVSPLPQTTIDGLGIIHDLLLVTFGNFILHFQPDNLNSHWWQNLPQQIDFIISSVALWLVFTSAFWIHQRLDGRILSVSTNNRSRDYFLFWFLLGAFSVFRQDIFEWAIPSNYGLQLISFHLTDFLGWFIMILLGRELYENILHNRMNEDRECLLEMDNVEMAQLWSAQFKEACIPFHIEGLRYRQITQIFAPYLKMRVWVAPQHKEDALRIMDLENLKQV